MAAFLSHPTLRAWLFGPAVRENSGQANRSPIARSRKALTHWRQRRASSEEAAPRPQFQVASAKRRRHDEIHRIVSAELDERFGRHRLQKHEYGQISGPFGMGRSQRRLQARGFHCCGLPDPTGMDERGHGRRDRLSVVVVGAIGNGVNVNQLALRSSVRANLSGKDNQPAETHVHLSPRVRPTTARYCPILRRRGNKTIAAPMRPLSRP